MRDELLHSMDPAEIRRGFSADSTIVRAETINAKGHATSDRIGMVPALFIRVMFY